MYDVIVIGGGPAGLTAALYVRRSGKTVLVIEKSTYGGQITWSEKLENFPAVTSVSGMEFADRLVEQVMERGADMELDEVSEIYALKSKAVILATGARPRMLGLDNEENFIGTGISYCAVCDGEFYKNKVAAVNGGGNTALQEALYLSQLCSKVYLIHRRQEFRGEKSLVKLLEEKGNVEFVLGSTIEGLNGERKLQSITLSDGRILNIDGLFIAIGHVPDNSVAADYIKLDEEGYADSDESCETEFSGLFVAGDCRKKQVRQVTTAVADGTSAALKACQYVDSY